MDQAAAAAGCHIGVLQAHMRDRIVVVWLSTAETSMRQQAAAVHNHDLASLTSAGVEEDLLVCRAGSDLQHRGGQQQ